jgi:hypothetical protein
MLAQRIGTSLSGGSVDEGKYTIAPVCRKNR